MGEPVPGIEGSDVITDAVGLRKNFVEAKEQERESARELRGYEGDLEESRESAEELRAGLEAVRGRLNGLQHERPSYSQVDTVEKANVAAEEIRQYEERVAAFRIVEAELSRLYGEADQEVSVARSNVEVVNSNLEGDNLVVRNANLEAEHHFRENEEAYKFDAVADAKSAGVDVKYPGYMRPRRQPQPEHPTAPVQPDVAPPAPVVGEGDGGGSE
jgi:hypothetical protein